MGIPRTTQPPAQPHTQARTPQWIMSFSHSGSTHHPQNPVGLLFSAPRTVATGQPTNTQKTHKQPSPPDPQPEDRKDETPADRPQGSSTQARDTQHNTTQKTTLSPQPSGATKTRTTNQHPPGNHITTVDLQNNPTRQTQTGTPQWIQPQRTKNMDIQRTAKPDKTVGTRQWILPTGNKVDHSTGDPASTTTHRDQQTAPTQGTDSTTHPPRTSGIPTQQVDFPDTPRNSNPVAKDPRTTRPAAQRVEPQHTEHPAPQKPSGISRANHTEPDSQPNQEKQAPKDSGTNPHTPRTADPNAPTNHPRQNSSWAPQVDSHRTGMTVESSQQGPQKPTVQPAHPRPKHQQHAHNPSGTSTPSQKPPNGPQKHDRWIRQ